MTSPERAIPDKCLTCPAIIMRRRHIDRHEEAVAEIITTAVSDEVDEEAQRLSGFFSEVISGNETDIPTPEEIAAFTRSESTRAMIEHNRLIDEHTNEIAAFALGCLGSLRLQGTKDGRRIITAEICMSPRLDDGDSTELANINRKLM